MTAENAVIADGDLTGVIEDKIPRRLRSERQRRKLSVRELARRVGVSASAISQIETGRARPSVAMLYAIVTELELSLDQLFGGEDDVQRRATSDQYPPGTYGFPVVHQGEREVIHFNAGVTWERLTPGSDCIVDFLYVVYESNACSSPDGNLTRHSGREYGLVLSGALEVTVQFDKHNLRAGDSIRFDSTTPHRLQNTSRAPATAIWVVHGRHHGPLQFDALEATLIALHPS
jgi:transcriptional regulator with XRE-family HTH domain